MQKVNSTLNPEWLDIISIDRKSGGQFSSLCSFYSHSCQDPIPKYCIFCDQLQQAEPLKRAGNTETLAVSVMELLDNFAGYVPSDQELNDIIEDEDLGMNTINLSFLDYFDNSLEAVDIIELN